MLIVDDDRTERRMIATILRRAVALDFKEAENGREALRILDDDKDQIIKLVILDLDMPVMGGLEAMEIIGKKYARIPVIVLSGRSNNAEIVKAMKSGAVDFLSKPVESARLDVSARNALKMARMSQEISRLKRHADHALQFSDLIGHDRGLKETVKTGCKAASSDLPVLITGETGTGKEMFARAIHGESQRAGQNFIAVNCGALPEKLVESILFGHEKGAFTGAIAKAHGKFQEASGGTIFLDEIGDLPLEAQVKLLRVLQQKEVEPVGAGKSVRVDVRVISATNRILSEEVKAGRFREDLFFRLNVLHIDLLPLRLRKEDIPDMIQYFIGQFCARHQVLPKEIHQDALLTLQDHLWPGNVRELENVISRTMALSEGHRLEVGDFSFIHTVENLLPLAREEGISPVHSDGTFKSFKALEQEIVMRALAHHGHNISRTARALGIAKSTLYTKMGTHSAMKPT